MLKTLATPAHAIICRVWNNELSYMTSDEISERLMQLWGVMDACIRDGVSSSALRLPFTRCVAALAETRTPTARSRGDPTRTSEGPAASARTVSASVQRCATSLRVEHCPQCRLLMSARLSGFYPSVTSPKPSPTPIAPPTVSLAGASSSKSTLSLASGIGTRSPASTSPNSASLAAINVSRSPRALTTGSFDHPLPVTPWKQATFPGIDFLSCYVRAHCLQ